MDDNNIKKQGELIFFKDKYQNQKIKFLMQVNLKYLEKRNGAKKKQLHRAPLLFRAAQT